MTLFLHHARQSLARILRDSPLVHPRTVDERNARLLYLSTALIGVPFGGIVSFLPVFLARLGASPTLIGWYNSAPALLAMLTLIPSAALAERFGNQVRVRVRASQIMRLSYLLCAAAPLVLPTHLLPVVLVAIWTVKTFPDAVATPAWTSVMTLAVSPRNRARLNGTRWALLSIMSAISSAVFGWLLDHIAFPANYQVVFLISFVFAGLDPMVFARIQVPDLARVEDTLSSKPLRRLGAYFRPVLAERSFLIMLGATALYRVALSVPTPLFSLYWVNWLEASDTLIGLRGTIGNGALVAGYLYWSRRADRVGHRRVLTLCALGLALYPVATALSPSAVWILPAAVIWGITVAGIDIGLFDLMLAMMPRERQPRFAAVHGIVGSGCIFLGPLLGASIAGLTSTRTALIVAGVAQAVTTIPFLLLPRDV